MNVCTLNNALISSKTSGPVHHVLLFPSSYKQLGTGSRAEKIKTYNYKDGRMSGTRRALVGRGCLILRANRGEASSWVLWHRTSSDFVAAKAEMAGHTLTFSRPS